MRKQRILAQGAGNACPRLIIVKTDILYENLQEGKAMVAVALKCPFCGSEDVRPYGTSNGKKRYACNNTECSHKTFYTEYTYNGCKSDVKKAIIKWTAEADGAGIRATARGLGVSTDIVTNELKKRKDDRVCRQRISGIT
jgi:transposase-like protein